MSDLSTLAEIAPVTAAGFIGNNEAQSSQTQGLEQQRLAQLIQSLQLQNQQSQQMNPLLTQKQDLENQGLQAGLPKTQADAILEQNKAKLSTDTLASDTQTTLSNNQTTQALNQAKTAGAGAQVLLATGLQGIAGSSNGPGGSAIAMDKYMKSHGIDESNAMYNYAMSHANNPQALIDYADTMSKHSEAYLQANDVEAKRATSAANVADITGRYHVAAIEKMGELGRWQNNKTATNLNDQIALQIKDAKGDPSKMYAIYSVGSQRAQQTGQMDQALQYSQLAMAVKNQAQVRDARNPNPTPDLSGMGVPTNPAPSINSPAVLNTPSVPQAAAPAGAAQKLPPGIQTVQDVRKLSPAYGNLTDDQIRTAIKNKYGVNVQ